MKNKKGFLLGEETIKIVVAVICIGFLVLLLVSIYFSLSGEEGVKQAAASMENLVKPAINQVNSGEVELSSKEITIPNPQLWHLFSFTEGDKKPSSCLKTNCVCICMKTSDISNFFNKNAQIDQCDDKGSCYSLNTIKHFETIQIGTTGISILIKNVNGGIEISPAEKK
ncbi:Uncharacterised protein [uncultured archaeon]|nr:Uncharacterised protein [uncultured archaeon]